MRPQANPIYIRAWGLLTWLLLGLAAIALLLLLLIAPAVAQAPKPGEPLIYSVKGTELYGAYCEVCHGPIGKGNGPMAPALKARMPDLTLLARRNGGQFPTERVRRILEGQERILPHGTQEMPIWGPIFHQIEYDQDLGAVRIDNLIKFLESIQQK